MSLVDKLKHYVFYLTEPAVDTDVFTGKRIPDGFALNIKQVKVLFQSTYNFADVDCEATITLRQRARDDAEPLNYEIGDIHKVNLVKQVGSAVGIQYLQQPFIWTPPAGFFIGGRILRAYLGSTATGQQVQAQVHVYGLLSPISEEQQIKFALELRP